ncbi:MAG TPA: TatD family hydrolase, partial [Patescibacteria group bacterium]|nr:TatD family hydrolase [Patescibacteria group bacterium]
MLIDSHTHINFISFKTDADEVIQRSLDNNIWLVNIGAQYSTSRRAVEIANKYSQGVYAAIGLHPVHLSSDIIETVSIDGKEIQFATKKEIFNYDKYKKLAESSDRVVAIGEVGVDYFYFDRYNLPVAENREIQLNIFKEFIRLSQELNLPLAVHCRGTKADPFSAYDDIYEAFKDSQTRGVIHCFGGSLEQAKKFIDLGFYVGFTG